MTLEPLIWDDADGAGTLASAGVISACNASSITSLGSTENGTFPAVPEPSSLALLAIGAAGVIGRRKRRTAA